MDKLTDISGIGEYTAVLLAKHGIKTVKLLAETTVEELETIPGFSSIRAARVNKAACNLIGSASKVKAVVTVENSTRSDKKIEQKVMKDKKDKKGKGGGKPKGKGDKKDKHKIKVKKQKAQGNKEKKSKKLKKANKK